MELGLFISTHNTPPGQTRQIAIKSPQSLNIIVCYTEENTISAHKVHAAVSVEHQYFVLLYSINVASTISYLIVFSGPIAVTPSFRPLLIFNPLWLECVLKSWTHWGRDEMASVLQTILPMHFLEWKLLWTQFSQICSQGPSIVKSVVLSQHFVFR